MDIKISGDYTDVNRVINGLMAAMAPKPVHSLAARTALKQVKSKYAQRFASQVNITSHWQETKQQVGGFLPLGPAPGFLTGTTFTSLVAEASAFGGWVYPKGPWPQGSGSAKSISTSAATPDDWTGFEWDAAGLYAQPAGSKPRMFPGSPSMMWRSYGHTNQKSEIEWLYLDTQDVDVIMENLTTYFTCVIERNHAGLKAVFQRAVYEADAGQEEPEAVIAEIISASTDPRIQVLENEFQMPIEDIYAELGVKNLRELILRREVLGEFAESGDININAQDRYEKGWGKDDKK